ncbi:hypothetical protein [Planctomycetes bacterium CA13]|uniref:hypothetical protein n=1 Tax=Novipirellula herctigrandis TaxID=2527986 RepID=UPI0011B6D52E
MPPNLALAELDASLDRACPPSRNLSDLALLLAEPTPEAFPDVRPVTALLLRVLPLDRPSENDELDTLADDSLADDTLADDD